MSFISGAQRHFNVKVFLSVIDQLVVETKLFASLCILETSDDKQLYDPISYICKVVNMLHQKIVKSSSMEIFPLFALVLRPTLQREILMLQRRKKFSMQYKSSVRTKRIDIITHLTQ
jgi:hypothetical protein